MIPPSYHRGKDPDGEHPSHEHARPTPVARVTDHKEWATSKANTSTNNASGPCNNKHTLDRNHNTDPAGASSLTARMPQSCTLHHTNRRGGPDPVQAPTRPPAPP